MSKDEERGLFILNSILCSTLEEKMLSKLTLVSQINQELTILRAAFYATASNLLTSENTEDIFPKKEGNHAID